MIARPHFHARAAERLEYAEAAAFERDSRAKHYPAMVKAGELGAEEAETDHAAWVAIQLWCAGQGLAAWTTLDTMVEAAAAGLARREAALSRASAEQRAGREARRDANAAIHALLSAHRDSCAEITTALRAETAKRRRAREGQRA